MAACIAVLDDDVTFAHMLATLLDDEGYPAIVAMRSEAGYTVVRDMQPQLVIINVHQDGRPDWPVLSRMPHDPRTATIPIIVCAHDRFALWGHEEFLRERTCMVLDRFNIRELLQAIETILESQLSVPQ